MSKNTTQMRAAVVREKGGPFNIETLTKEIKKLSPMETDQQPEASAVFLQTLTSAVSDLKNRLQRDYEQAYPGLGNVVRIVLDEEEERAWDLSSFPQLLLPDLVEGHMERLGLQPVSMRHDNLLAPAAFVEIESDSLSPAYVDCPSLGGYVTGTGPRVGCPPPEGVDVAYPLNEPATRPSAPTKPRVLVVYAHPNPKSYTHAVLEAVQAGLGERCEVQTLDLYATGFDPVLVVDETRRRRDLDQVEETRAPPRAARLVRRAARSRVVLEPGRGVLVLRLPPGPSLLPRAAEAPDRRAARSVARHRARARGPDRRAPARR